MHTSFSPPSFPRLSAARTSSRKVIRAGAAAAVAFGTTGVLALGSAPAIAAPAACGHPTVTKQFFGRAFDSYFNKKLPVFRYTLSNCHRMQVRIITYGATTQSIVVPGRTGKLANIALGFRTLNDYVTKDSPPQGGGTYFGETIGRYGNRIAKGTFVLDGVRYHLPINNNGNSLHGGMRRHPDLDRSARVGLGDPPERRSNGGPSVGGVQRAGRRRGDRRGRLLPGDDAFCHDAEA